MKVGRQTLNRQNSCGEEVIRTPSKSPYIVKFPAAASERAPHTVLFVGDSFTNGTGVSTGLAYYDVVEELAEGRLRIFASGIRNYGTSQERMLIEAIFDQVRPDLIVWQLTENDAIDNRFILDDEIPTNNRRPRPYLDLESGRYAALPAPVYLRGFLRQYALCLKLDPVIVATEYLKHYSLWAESEGPKERGWIR